MRNDKPAILLRDCEAIRVPSGDRINLVAGSRVWITQSLGGGITVTTDRGIMVWIAGKDGDALGLEKDLPKEPEPSGSIEEAGDIVRLVWDRLRSCFDPEIPVNIVELGLIYGVESLGSHKVRVGWMSSLR